MTDLAANAAGASDPLVPVLAAAWARVAGEISTLLQHPVEIRHESLQRVEPKGLKQLLPEDGVATAVAVEAETGFDTCLVFALDLSIHLAGTLLLTRKDDLETKLATRDLNEGDQDAVGEVANIMASAVDEALRERTPYQMHLVRKAVARLSSGEGPAALPKEGQFAVEVMTMDLPGQGAGRLVWSMPAELALLIAGASEEASTAAVEEAGAAPAEAAAAAGKAAPATPATGGTEAPAAGAEVPVGDAGLPADGAAQALVAGPVAQDNRDIEEALRTRGFSVVSLPHLKGVPAAVAGTAYDLVVLAAPPLSLAALSLLREATATPGAPPFIVVTRRPTPGYVFQSVRAGARYVAVLPLADTAADRMVQFAAECRQAA